MENITKEALVEEFRKDLPCLDVTCDQNGTAVGGSPEEPEPVQCEYCYRERFPRIEAFSTALDRYGTAQRAEGVREAQSTEAKMEIYEDGQRAGEKIAIERAMPIIKSAVSLVELLEYDKKLSEADYELYGYGECCAEIKIMGKKFLDKSFTPTDTPLPDNKD